MEELLPILITLFFFQITAVLYQTLYPCIQSKISFSFQRQADLFCNILLHPGVSWIQCSHPTVQKPHKQVFLQRKGHSPRQIFSWKVIPFAQLCFQLFQTFPTAKSHPSTASSDNWQFLSVFKLNNNSAKLISLMQGLLPPCKSRIIAPSWMEFNLDSFRSSWDPNSPISNILFQIAKLLVRTQTFFLREEFKWVVSDVFTERDGEFICTSQRTSSSL